MSKEEILHTLALLFPTDMNEMKIKAYSNVLFDLNEEHWVHAFQVLSNSPSRKTFPTPGEIRSAAYAKVEIEQNIIDIEPSTEEESFFKKLMPGRSVK